MPSLPDSHPPPVPPPVPVETHPNRTGGLKPPSAEQRALPDPTRLAPEDAYYAPSLLRNRPGSSNHEDPIRSLSGTAAAATAASVAALRPPPAVPGAVTRKENRKPRTGARKKRKGAWKKLLWVKQSCTHIMICCLTSRRSC
jgi:phosphatidylinositol glycan class C protein